MFDDLHDPAAPAATASHFAEVAVRARRLQRRRSIGVTVAAALLIGTGVAALLVLPLRDATSVAPSDTAPPITQPLASASPTPSVATTPTTIAVPSTTDSTAPPSTDSEPTDPEQVGELIATIHERAATVAGFSVKVDLTTSADDVVVSSAVATVTLLADDSMWMEPIEGAWGAAGQGYFASYDPTTGVSRIVYAGPDGVPIAQEIVGWNENSTGQLIVMGHAPILALDPSSDVEISDDVHDGRAVWRIAHHAGETDFVWWVDQASGLTVRERTQTTSVDAQTNQRVVNVQDSSWTDLEFDVELPASFPGVIPDGISVERSGDPNGHIAAPYAAALATAFGSDLLLPAPADGELAKQPSITPDPDDYDENGLPRNTPGTAQGVGVVLARGFATTTVFVWAEPSTPPASVPGAQTTTIDGGYLAGRTATIDATSVTVSVPGPERTIVVIVTAPTIADALEVLTRVQPAAALTY